MLRYQTQGAIAMASSFGRFGGVPVVCFPENCNTSTSGWCSQQTCWCSRGNCQCKSHVLSSEHGEKRFARVSCSVAVGNGSFSPFTDVIELPEDQAKRRTLENYHSMENYPTKASDLKKEESIWKSKLPRWAFEKLEQRELNEKIKELSKRRQLQKIFEILNSPKKKRLINLKNMNAAMEACVHCGDVYRAMELFRSMTLEGACGVDEVSYGTLLKGLGNAGKLDTAFAILQTMETGRAPGNPKLSDVHLNTLINACANAGDVKRALVVLGKYKYLLSQKAPSLITCNMLIKGFSRSDNPLEAIKVKAEMQLRGLQPDRVTWNTLVLSCVRGRNLHMAFDLLTEMKEVGKGNPDVAPNVVTYSTLIKGLAQAGDLNGVLNMVLEMKASKTCVIDRVGYTCIIDACIAAGSIKEALKFFLEMESLGSKDSHMKPRAHAFLALMRQFSAIGDFESVAMLKSKLVTGSSGHIWPENRLEADELFIEAAVNSKQIAQGLEAFKHLMSLNKPLHFSDRGFMAIVRLQAMTDFAENLLEPVFVKKEISLRAPLESILPQIVTIKPVHPWQRIGDVILHFVQQDQVPVCDESGKCVGMVYAKHCVEMDATVQGIMHAPPVQMFGSIPIGAVLDTLLQPDSGIVAVNTSAHGSEAVTFITKDVVLNALSQKPK